MAKLPLICLLFIFLHSSVSSSSSIVLKDNGYEGVVVALDESLPIEYCQELIQGFESLIRSASSVVFQTTRRRASFRDLTVLVPKSWTASSCPQLQNRLKAATGESWATADIRITKLRHPLFGPRPWTLQSKGCGQQGDYISLGHEILYQNETEANARLLANAWLKYRYGVFEEVGVDGSTTHPTTYRNSMGEWVATACTKFPLHDKPACDINANSCPQDVAKLSQSDTKIKESFMAFPEATTVTELCDEGSHNSVAPTPHNLICGSASVWEVLRASPDFQNNRNVEGLARAADIRINFVQSNSPRMVLLVEDTNIMNVQKRWDFMRKAVRKLVEYDVPDGFSVGLVVFDDTATVKYPLSNDGSRLNLASSLPRNPSTVDKHRRCVTCGLEKSINMLKQDNGAASGGHIVLIMAGSGHVDQPELETASKMLQDTNIVLHIIVYPLTDKFPQPGSGIKALGSRTGGLTFTIPDEGIGADSKINMYYNLLDSLYYTVSAAAGEDVLPVKIHSEEHVGGLIQSEGSFWVDPGLGENTVFAVFYYDIAHVGDTIHLISPHGQTIDTGNMQKEDDNINMITIPLRKNQEAHGLWKYKLENRADSHQAIFVQVTSRPRKSADATKIKVRTWTNHVEGQVNITNILNPLKVYAEVRIGLAPVEEAEINVIFNKLGVTANGTEYEPIRIKLMDNGLLSPDIKRGDGVYSRIVSHLPEGKYNAMLRIEGQLDQFKFTRQLLLGIFDIFRDPTADDIMRPSRIIAQSEPAPLIDMLPPSRITNLHASFLSGTDGQISLGWTAPGDDYDFGTAHHYEVMIHSDILRLRDGKGDILDGWPTPMHALAIQQHTITWREYETVFYLAMYAVDEAGNSARLGNVVEIYVPAPKITLPAMVVTLPNAKQGQEVSAASSPILANFDITQLIIVLLCVAGVVIICAVLACYCFSANRKSKVMASKNKEPKDSFNVAVTVGSKPSDFAQEKHGDKKDYLRPINSWSPTELLGHHDKRASLSGRSDNNSDHSGSTKKSYGGSSDPPQYYSGGVHYSYEGNSFNDPYHNPSDGYPTPVEGYPQTSATYLQQPQEGYHVESYAMNPENRTYATAPPPSDSFMSESCDMLPGTQGPPGYSAHTYDSRQGTKVPPPIPPKPKVQYTPEPYSYEGLDLIGNNSSSNGSVSSEKRVRNVTMV